MPPTRTATLANATSPTPTFVADLQGDYLLRLVVTDPFVAASEPDTVLVRFNNVPPVADAGDTKTVLVGTTVVLDGGESTDANGDPLTFLWSLVSKPLTSLAALDDSTASTPRFVADESGTYLVSLVVNDGLVDSEPSSVTIMAISTQTQLSQTLGGSIDALNALDPAVFKNASLQNATTSKLVAVLDQIEQGLFQQALDKLENDILGKLNGCSEGGAPDRNDWITDCGAQAQVYPLIIEAIGLIESPL